ncbi:MAG: SPASM domain-containing protein [Lachnobacterium sp.]|nr:SPASM domain-containing protein [Lachnobacterium sp.]
MKKKILFGAGLYGRLALAKYGKESVAYFVDNNENLVGQYIEDIEIISFETLKKIYKSYSIVITTKYRHSIAKQLKENGMIGYSYYYEKGERYYPTNELVVNPYQDEVAEYLDNSHQGIQQKIRDIDMEVEQLYNSSNLFNHIEIETINRCNGNCSFCPVSVKNDRREFHEMSDDLFKSIIDQLSEMKYEGRLALFSNNEPFLDKKIVERHKYAREKCPHARMHLFTNGTLLKIEQFTEIINYLDELVIDNYNQKLELLETSKKIKEYCEQHPELRDKVTIILRKPREVLTNRGGDAPNRKAEECYPNAKCTLPFKQLIVRPNGMVSLCCNDALGTYSLADLNKETLIEAWNNPRFQMVRKCLYAGRKNWKKCKKCDVFNIG